MKKNKAKEPGERFRVKNLTGGEVIFLEGGQVRFNLYPEDKEVRSNESSRLY